MVLRYVTVGLLFLAPSLARADLRTDLVKCANDKNNVTRLACFDALAGVAKAQDPASSSSFVSKWRVTTETSPIDDSKNVYLTLEAEDAVVGWPSKKHTPTLHIRCKERKTELYVVTGMSPTVEYGVDTATVTLRLDKAPAYKLAASKSTDGEALFLPNAVGEAKRYMTAQTLLFQFVPFNSSGQMTTFDLRGLSDALKPLRAACKW